MVFFQFLKKYIADFSDLLIKITKIYYYITTIKFLLIITGGHIMKQILFIIILVSHTTYSSYLRVTNLSHSPIIFNYYSAGKHDPNPIEIGSKQSRRFHPGPHGVDAVTWSYKPVIKKTKKDNLDTENLDNKKRNFIDSSMYSVPLEVSPIRIGQTLYIYDKGICRYTLDCDKKQAIGTK